MRYEIFGETLPAVTIQLDKGERIYTQRGGMMWMSSNMSMETNMQGGVLKGLARRFAAGSSMFMATYTAESNGQTFTAASSFPGSILAYDVSRGNIIAQTGAFLCAETGVGLDVYTVPGLGTMFFGGEGVFMQELSGKGIVFLEIDGSAKEIELQRGEMLKVNTGNIAAFEKTVTFSIERIKGLKNIAFGGEGLFISTVEGPGRVWLQTMAKSTVARQLIPFLPSSGTSSSSISGAFGGTIAGGILGGLLSGDDE